MSSDAMQVIEQEAEVFDVQWFGIQYPLSAYTFPTEIPRIHQVHFDDEFLHVELVDGRNFSIPLWWIPTLYHAEPEEREKYVINRSRTMIVWDPRECAINETLRIADYLGPCSQER